MLSFAADLGGGFLERLVSEIMAGQTEGEPFAICPECFKPIEYGAKFIERLKKRKAKTVYLYFHPWCFSEHKPSRARK